MAKCAYGFLKIGPRGTLLYFTFISFLIYLDRGAIAGVITSIEDTYDVGSAMGGLLGSIFMLGFMFASPFVAHFSQTYHPLFLIMIGQLIWMVAAAGSGLSPNYWVLLSSRAITGVGEASFISLGPPMIMDLAPKKHVTLWLSVLYSMAILGVAVGFAFSATLNEVMGSWRWPFIIEAFLMVPFVIVLLVAKKEPLNLPNRQEEASESEGEIMSLKTQMARLLSNPVFCVICLGFGFYMFTVGGLTFWGPTVIHKLYGLSELTSAYFLGGACCVCGIAGTVIGSVFVDICSRKYSRQLQKDEITQEKYDFHRTEICSFILFTTTGVGCAICMVAIIFDTIYSFMIGTPIGMFFFFLATGPRSLAVMTSTSPELRGQANAVSVFFMHLLGDFPSPYVIGVLIDAYGYYWGYFILIMILWLSVVFWMLSWHFSVIFT